jgi:hypothetical protein
MNLSTFRNGVLALVAGFLTAGSSYAGDGRMVCSITERAPYGRETYEIEDRSRENHTVRYYDYARVIERFYLRFSGMVGGGAHFLHLHIEDTETGLYGFTRVEAGGKIRFGNEREWVEAECWTEAD